MSARVDDVRGVLQRARDRLGGERRAHDPLPRRDPPLQQGPAGRAAARASRAASLTLIGATTENPYFEVNAALLSRCAVVELEPLSDDEVAAVVGAGRGGARRRGARRRRRGDRAQGRRRRAQRALDARARLADGASPRARRSRQRHVADAARKRPLRYDRAGDQHYDIISAFIKSMRGSDPDAAVYYLAAMLEGGEDARFIARRMVILASEDVGNADPRALVVAVAAAQALEHVGLPEAQLNLAQAAIYLANAPEVERVGPGDLGGAGATCRERGNLPPPPTLRDAHYAGARDARARRGLRLPARRPGAAQRRPPPGGLSRAGRTMFPPATERRAAMAIGTGEQAPEFDLEEAFGRRACASRTSAASATSCSSSIRSPSRPSAARRRSTCRRTSSRSRTPRRRWSSSPATPRQRGRPGRRSSARPTRSRRISGSTARRRARTASSTRRRGAPVRGTFLIDKDGIVIWSLVRDGPAPTEMVPGAARSTRRQA